VQVPFGRRLVEVNEAIGFRKKEREKEKAVENAKKWRRFQRFRAASIPITHQVEIG